MFNSWKKSMDELELKGTKAEIYEGKPTRDRGIRDLSTNVFPNFKNCCLPLLSHESAFIIVRLFDVPFDG